MFRIFFYSFLLILTSCKVKCIAVLTAVNALCLICKQEGWFYVVLCLGDAARVLALENSLYTAWKLHVDFADDFFVFDYVYAD